MTSENIDYRQLSKSGSLSATDLEKYKDKLWWVEVVENHSQIPNKVFDKYHNYIKVQYYYHNQIREKYLQDNKEYLNWSQISKFWNGGKSSPYCENILLDNFADKIDWEAFSERIELSKSIIEKYKDKLNLKKVIKNHILPYNILIENDLFYDAIRA